MALPLDFGCLDTVRLECTLEHQNGPECVIGGTGRTEPTQGSFGPSVGNRRDPRNSARHARRGTAKTDRSGFCRSWRPTIRVNRQILRRCPGICAAAFD